jgi:hypothetical protein
MSDAQYRWKTTGHELRILRQFAEMPDDTGAYSFKDVTIVNLLDDYQQARDEIERLRAELETARAVAHTTRIMLDSVAPMIWPPAADVALTRAIDALDALHKPPK